MIYFAVLGILCIFVTEKLNCLFYGKNSTKKLSQYDESIER